MEHGEVGVGVFLPAGEDAAETVEPGVGAFDDPAAGAEAGLVFDRLGLFATPRMWAVKANSAASSRTSLLS